MEEAKSSNSDLSNVENDDVESLFTDDVAEAFANKATDRPLITPKSGSFSKATTSPEKVGVKHPAIGNYSRLTDKELVLIKRMQDFVEDFEALKKDLSASKQQIHTKYKTMMYRLDRHVQQHLKNGVPRIAKAKVATRKKSVGKIGGA